MGRASISDQLKAGKAAAERRKAKNGLRRKSQAAAQSVDLGPYWPEAERRRKPCHANGRAMKVPSYTTEKLLGRCTKADSDAYTLLMNACGGDAARVLREYAYFSPELKAILEKAALMQADRNRTGGMFHAPKSSPWGEVQSCEILCPGVFTVLPPATAERWWQTR